MAINKFMRLALKVLSYPDIDIRKTYPLERSIRYLRLPALLPKDRWQDHTIVSEGRKILTRIYTPEDNTGKNTLLFFHGGGWVTCLLYTSISNVFLLLTRSLASAHRIGQVLEEQPAFSSPEQPVGQVRDGSVDFDRVFFKYKPEAQEYALSDVSLSIKAGQTVGVLGGTGSAKTTLVQLIPRLYDASRGTVRVGGRDVRDYDLRALRDAVGIVLQKNVLFSGTIRENLLWGNPEADDDTLWEACRKARADEFIERLPKGMDTDLGQGGVNVSGGQKQRLCIARTLLKKPKVLIFDDSTSAVDTATEGEIREALAKLTDVTKIIIAQRITSVMDTDQIIILDDGRIHGTGTHRELLEKDSIYQEIYASQMKGEKD